MSSHRHAMGGALSIDAPYTIFIGDVTDPIDAKTGFGLVQWCPERVTAQTRLPSCTVDLGVKDMSVEDAARAGIRSFVIGVAPPGGSIKDSWWSIIERAAQHGIDIVSGLHFRLNDNSRLVKIADQSGARLIDVRVPPEHIPVATGRKRAGKRLLTVGTDCAVGKKYAALSLNKEMMERGWRSTFRASGQTGIMIAGSGIPLDAVVSDFLTGAAELLSPDTDTSHWDVIEGQGSLFHPAYSAVSLGLLHGSQPDAIVVCHEAGRQRISGWPDYQVPSIAKCLERNLLEARTTNASVSCVGICVNTAGLHDDDRRKYLNQISKELSIPCVDPIIDGCAPIIDHLDAVQHGC